MKKLSTILGICLLLEAVSIADDKPKVIVTDAHSWERAPNLGEAFDELARFNWVKTWGCPRSEEILSTFREQCRRVLGVGDLQDADYVLVFDNHDSNEVTGFAATTRDLVMSKSGSSLSESVQQACDGIAEHWAANGNTMRAGLGAKGTSRESANANPTATGSLTGVVVDENGHPMSGAVAYVERVGARFGMQPQYTGSDGRFSESNLEWGTYFVDAEKPAAGYTTDHYHSSVLELSPENPNATVIVGLGIKAGVLLLSATDAVSGQPVEHASVQVSSQCPPETRATSAGRVLLPPDREYTLVVSAPGYESWHYTTDTGHIRLESEQELRLEAPLKRQGETK
jgi:hypothetical protein